MSTLYIRLPSKAIAEKTQHWLALVCPFALAAHGGVIEREGAAPLKDLSDTVAKAKRVVLLLAASDVALLRVQVPPLSPAKLKTALPNLVEDQLICDPADCLVVAGGLSDGLRTVSVVERAWLNLLAKTFISFGARQVAALPAQLCLHCQPGGVASAINEHGPYIDITLRTSEQDGIGLAINVDQNETAAHEVIQTLCTVVPKSQVSLYVPQSVVQVYQEAVNKTSELNGRINVFADTWQLWIAGANNTALDLMKGQAGNGPRLEWDVWRWPLALAALILTINVVALNVDWWRMKSEASSLRTSMTQIYKSAYPDESVIIDPIAQMQQKITIAKRNSGLVAPDDFIALTAAFGEAWASALTGKAAPAIAALEYRERGLFVRLKPAPSRAEGPDGEALAQQMRISLAMHNLSLDLVSAQSTAVVWRIRSAK